MLANTEITANIYITVGEGKEAHEEVYASVGVKLVDLLQGAQQVGSVCLDLQIRDCLRAGGW